MIVIGYVVGEGVGGATLEPDTVLDVVIGCVVDEGVAGAERKEDAVLIVVDYV